MLLPIAFALLLQSRAEAPAPPTLRDILPAATRDGKIPADLYVLAGRRDGTDAPYRETEVWGDGIGIEDGSREFRLSASDVLAILADVVESGYLELGAAPGGDGKKAELSVRARVLVRAGGVSKDEWRSMRDPRTPSLEGLAARIAARCRGAAGRGVTVSSVDDALGKLRSGVLSPHALRLTFQSTSEKGDASGVRAGWMLSLAGRDVEVRTSSPGTGVGPIVSRRLSDAEFRSLVETLRKGRLAEAPATLFSPRYEELAINALGRARTIQARGFAGLDEHTHAGAQKWWKALREVLERLYSDTVKR